MKTKGNYLAAKIKKKILIAQEARGKKIRL
jgi:hypothetical protein